MSRTEIADMRVAVRPGGTVVRDNDRPADVRMIKRFEDLKIKADGHFKISVIRTGTHSDLF